MVVDMMLDEDDSGGLPSGETRKEREGSVTKITERPIERVFRPKEGLIRSDMGEMFPSPKVS